MKIELGATIITLPERNAFKPKPYPIQAHREKMTENHLIKYDKLDCPQHLHTNLTTLIYSSMDLGSSGST